jgi:rhodanese-related sulfurtransferase/DNA-binding transcriptional ArsR family regulator
MNPSKNGSREHKEHLYELFAQISNALANPHRLELLDLLIQTPRTVEELADQAQMSVANTSQHLQRLKQAHLVTDKRDGQFIRYSLADPAIARLWLDLRDVAERQLPEVEQALNRYRPRRRDFARITAADLRERMERDTVVLIDVRAEVEYQAGHLPGTISMPIDTLEQHVDELPKSKTIVATCRGPYCVDADQALELLASRGWQVARLEEGVAEWQEAGYALEN